MKTQHNYISILFLILGLISINGIGCAKKDWTRQGEFDLVNATARKVVIADPNKTYEILPGATLHISQVQPSNKDVVVESYEDPFTQEVGPRLSLTVKIGDKCLTASKDSEHSILHIASYQSQKLDERSYKFTYTFTDADYGRAGDCK
jgi:hypothetical protein